MGIRLLYIFLLLVATVTCVSGPRPGHGQDRPAPSMELAGGDRLMDLVYHEPASVKRIYRALGKEAGINVLFDTRLRDQPLHIELVQVTALQGLEMLTQTAGHGYKVVYENVVIIYEDTPSNRRLYANPRRVEEIELEVPTTTRGDLVYPEPTSLMEIYRRPGREAGIHVVFERHLRDGEMTLELAQVTPLQGLVVLMQALHHFYKVVDDHTILILADTPKNRGGLDAKRYGGSDTRLDLDRAKRTRP